MKDYFPKIIPDTRYDLTNPHPALLQDRNLIGLLKTPTYLLMVLKFNIC